MNGSHEAKASTPPDYLPARRSFKNLSEPFPSCLVLNLCFPRTWTPLSGPIPVYCLYPNQMPIMDWESWVSSDRKANEKVCHAETTDTKTAGSKLPGEREAVLQQTEWLFLVSPYIGHQFTAPLLPPSSRTLNLSWTCDISCSHPFSYPQWAGSGSVLVKRLWCRLLLSLFLRVLLLFSLVVAGFLLLLHPSTLTLKWPTRWRPFPTK